MILKRKIGDTINRTRKMEKKDKVSRKTLQKTKKEKEKKEIWQGKVERSEAGEKQELTRPRRERGAKAWDRTRVRRNLIYDRGCCKFHLAPRNSAETAQWTRLFTRKLPTTMSRFISQEQVPKLTNGNEFQSDEKTLWFLVNRWKISWI